MSSSRAGSKYKDLAVLFIVPAVVAVLILASWGLAHWEIGKRERSF